MTPPTSRIPAADVFELHLEAALLHHGVYMMAKLRLDQLARSPFLPDDDARRMKADATYMRDAAWADRRREVEQLRSARDRMIREAKAEGADLALEACRGTFEVLEAIRAEDAKRAKHAETAVSPLDAYREHDGFPEFLSEEQWGTIDGRSVA